MRGAGGLALLQLRRGWRGLVMPTLLLTGIASLVMAGAAGARRTATVVERSFEATEAWHVIVNPDEGAYSELDFGEVRRLAPVADSVRLDNVAVLPPGSVTMASVVNPLRRPADIESLESLRRLPIVSVYLVLVAAAVVHALVVSVRRRGRELALMQTLGVRRRTLRAASAMQAATTAALACAIGVPLGVVAGRWAWTLLASAFGTIAAPVAPVAWILLFAVAAVVASATVGFLPATLMLRRRPGLVLREEE